MSEHAVALIGTGEHPDAPGSDGVAMAYNHADIAIDCASHPSVRAILQPASPGDDG